MRREPKLHGWPSSIPGARDPVRLRDYTFVVAAITTAIACRPTAAPESVVAPAPEPEPKSEPEVRLRLEPTPEGARAVLELSPPRTTLTFAARDSVSRFDWVVATEGAQLEGRVISSVEPMSTLTLELPFDTKPRDRVYPAVTRVGAGTVIHMPSMLLQDVDVEWSTGPDTAVWPPLRAPWGYSYLGVEDDLVRRSDASFVGFDAIVPWLGDAIRTDTAQALAYYEAMLGQPAKSVTVIASDETLGLRGFHGDVTDNAVIFLRFGEGSLERSPEETTANIARFVRHEAFHLWDEGSAPGTPPWLHEGAAEYAALVAAVTAGAVTEEQGRRAVSQAVGRCRGQLGDGAFEDVRGGSLVYDCGVTLQWLADLHMRKESDGARTVLAIWRELLPGGEAGRYSLADFRERAGALMGGLLDGTAEQRWESVMAGLAFVDVKVSTTPTPRDYGAAMLHHLGAQACGGGQFGYWTERDHVRLDTGDPCGVLAGRPRVTTVAGKHVLKAPRRAFEAMARACRKGKAVNVETLEGEVLKVPCAEALADPQVLVVEAMPPLAAAPPS